jgi:hypothetical protein
MATHMDTTTLTVFMMVGSSVSSAAAFTGASIEEASTMGASLGVGSPEEVLAEGAVAGAVADIARFLVPARI